MGKGEGGMGEGGMGGMGEWGNGGMGEWGRGNGGMGKGEGGRGIYFYPKFATQDLSTTHVSGLSTKKYAKYAYY